MKKMLLASYAAQTLDLAGELFAKPAQELHVAFIPTAADPYENKDFVEIDRQALLARGMHLTEVDLKITRGTALEKVLAAVDVIFVAGGNTYYLLDQVKKSGFDQLLPKYLEQGVVYIGSSAGSVPCGSTIAVARRFDDPAQAPDLTNYDGLGLVDFAILPHVQKEKYHERIKLTLAEMAALGHTVVQLTDNQAVVVVGEEVEVKRSTATG